MSGLNETVLQQLQDMLHQCNPYVHTFLQLHDILEQNPTQNLSLVIKAKRCQHAR